MPRIEVDKYLCVGCERCVLSCPNRLFHVEGAKNIPEPIPDAGEKCISCYHCVAICPVRGISVGNVSGRQCEPIPTDAVPRFEHIATLLRSRRSIRRFSAKPLDERTLEQMLDVVRWAPTARNLLPVKWVVVNGRDKMRELGSLTAEWMRTVEGGLGLAQAWDDGVDHLLRGAPCLAVAYTEEDALWPEVDCTIAVETLDLSAAAMRIGACWAGYFIQAARHSQPINRWLGLSETQTVQAALMLGYTDIEIYGHIPVRPELDVRYIRGTAKNSQSEPRP